jgi:hypothetical protein
MNVELWFREFIDARPEQAAPPAFTSVGREQMNGHFAV